MPRQVVRMLLMVLCCASSVQARPWAVKMFETSNHDFGTVARGGTAEFDFPFQNIYKEDVHVASVRSTCGCTTPTILKKDLKTWDKSAIRAKFNTRSFLGKKSATITVVIDKPFPAEVQLTVSGYIRSDVVIEPGSVEFGDVDEGTSPELKVDVGYAGRNDWRLTDVQSAATFFQVRLIEKRRGGGKVGYDMMVRLTTGAPSGYFTEQLILVTNDSKLQRIPLRVAGHVVPSLSVSPAALSMGVVAPGQTVQKQLVVRAKRPFKILKVQCDDDGFSFKMSDGEKKLHLIPVSYTAGDSPGRITQTIQIETDLGAGATTSCQAMATVKVPETAAAN